jgi:hypothetical protein
MHAISLNKTCLIFFIQSSWSYLYIGRIYFIIPNHRTIIFVKKVQTFRSDIFSETAKAIEDLLSSTVCNCLDPEEEEPTSSMLGPAFSTDPEIQNLLDELVGQAETLSQMDEDNDDYCEVL